MGNSASLATAVIDEVEHRERRRIVEEFLLTGPLRWHPLRPQRVAAAAIHARAAFESAGGVPPPLVRSHHTTIGTDLRDDEAVAEATTSSSNAGNIATAGHSSPNGGVAIRRKGRLPQQQHLEQRRLDVKRQSIGDDRGVDGQPLGPHLPTTVANGLTTVTSITRHTRGSSGGGGANEGAASSNSRSSNAGSTLVNRAIGSGALKGSSARGDGHVPVTAADTSVVTIESTDGGVDASPASPPSQLQHMKQGQFGGGGGIASSRRESAASNAPFLSVPSGGISAATAGAAAGGASSVGAGAGHLLGVDNYMRMRRVSAYSGVSALTVDLSHTNTSRHAGDDGGGDRGGGGRYQYANNHDPSEMFSPGRRAEDFAGDDADEQIGGAFVPVDAHNASAHGGGGATSRHASPLSAHDEAPPTRQPFQRRQSELAAKDPQQHAARGPAQPPLLIVIHGRVYDVTEWQYQHPGGRPTLWRWATALASDDAMQHFEEYYSHFCGGGSAGAKGQSTASRSATFRAAVLNAAKGGHIGSGSGSSGGPASAGGNAAFGSAMFDDLPAISFLSHDGHGGGDSGDGGGNTAVGGSVAAKGAAGAARPVNAGGSSSGHAGISVNVKSVLAARAASEAVTEPLRGVSTGRGTATGNAEVGLSAPDKKRRRTSFCATSTPSLNEAAAAASTNVQQQQQQQASSSSTSTQLFSVSASTQQNGASTTTLGQAARLRVSAMSTTTDVFSPPALLSASADGSPIGANPSHAQQQQLQPHRVTSFSTSTLPSTNVGIMPLLPLLLAHEVRTNVPPRDGGLASAATRASLDTFASDTLRSTAAAVAPPVVPSTAGDADDFVSNCQQLLRRWVSCGDSGRWFDRLHTRMTKQTLVHQYCLGTLFDSAAYWGAFELYLRDCAAFVNDDASSPVSDDRQSYELRTRVSFVDEPTTARGQRHPPPRSRMLVADDENVATDESDADGTSAAVVALEASPDRRDSSRQRASTTGVALVRSQLPTPSVYVHEAAPLQADLLGEPSAATDLHSVRTQRAPVVRVDPHEANGASSTTPFHSWLRGGGGDGGGDHTPVDTRNEHGDGGSFRDEDKSQRLSLMAWAERRRRSLIYHWRHHTHETSRLSQHSRPTPVPFAVAKEQQYRNTRRESEEPHHEAFGKLEGDDAAGGLFTKSAADRRSVVRSRGQSEVANNRVGPNQSPIDASRRVVKTVPAAAPSPQAAAAKDSRPATTVRWRQQPSSSRPLSQLDSTMIPQPPPRSTDGYSPAVFSTARPSSATLPPSAAVVGDASLLSTYQHPSTWVFSPPAPRPVRSWDVVGVAQPEAQVMRPQSAGVYRPSPPPPPPTGMSNNGKVWRGYPRSGLLTADNSISPAATSMVPSQFIDGPPTFVPRPSSAPTTRESGLGRGGAAFRARAVVAAASATVTTDGVTSGGTAAAATDGGEFMNLGSAKPSPDNTAAPEGNNATDEMLTTTPTIAPYAPRSTAAPAPTFTAAALHHQQAQVGAAADYDVTEVLAAAGGGGWFDDALSTFASEAKSSAVSASTAPVDVIASVVRVRPFVSPCTGRITAVQLTLTVAVDDVDGGAERLAAILSSESQARAETALAVGVRVSPFYAAERSGTQETRHQSPPQPPTFFSSGTTYYPSFDATMSAGSHDDDGSSKIRFTVVVPWTEQEVPSVLRDGAVGRRSDQLASPSSSTVAVAIARWLCGSAHARSVLDAAARLWHARVVQGRDVRHRMDELHMAFRRRSENGGSDEEEEEALLPPTLGSWVPLATDAALRVRLFQPAADRCLPRELQDTQGARDTAVENTNAGALSIFVAADPGVVGPMLAKARRLLFDFSSDADGVPMAEKPRVILVAAAASYDDFAVFEDDIVQLCLTTSAAVVPTSSSNTTNPSGPFLPTPRFQFIGIVPKPPMGRSSTGTGALPGGGGITRRLAPRLPLSSMAGRSCVENNQATMAKEMGHAWFDRLRALPCDGPAGEQLQLDVEGLTLDSNDTSRGAGDRYGLWYPPQPVAQPHVPSRSPDRITEASFSGHATATTSLKIVSAAFLAPTPVPPNVAFPIRPSALSSSHEVSVVSTSSPGVVVSHPRDEGSAQARHVQVAKLQRGLDAVNWGFHDWPLCASLPRPGFASPPSGPTALVQKSSGTGMSISDLESRLRGAWCVVEFSAPRPATPPTLEAGAGVAATAVGAPLSPLPQQYKLLLLATHRATSAVIDVSAACHRSGPSPPVRVEVAGTSRRALATTLGELLLSTAEAEACVTVAVWRD